MGIEALTGRFQDVVRTEAELRAATGEAHQRALDKVVTTLDGHSRRFIAASPFVLIGTTGPGGVVDVSPKGDPAGFVRVLDDRTLAVPDRLGNRRYDTFRNLLADPRVGLIFLVPGVAWTLRVSGAALIVADAALRDACVVNGKRPDHVMVVAVEQVLAHCPKCMIRSGLWRPEAWPDVSGVPSLAETLIAHAKIAESVEAVAASLETSNRERLY